MPEQIVTKEDLGRESTLEDIAAFRFMRNLCLRVGLGPELNESAVNAIKKTLLVAVDYAIENHLIFELSRPENEESVDFTVTCSKREG